MPGRGCARRGDALHMSCRSTRVGTALAEETAGRPSPEPKRPPGACSRRLSGDAQLPILASTGCRRGQGPLTRTHGLGGLVAWGAASRAPDGTALSPGRPHTSTEPGGNPSKDVLRIPPASVIAGRTHLAPQRPESDSCGTLVETICASKLPTAIGSAGGVIEAPEGRPGSCRAAPALEEFRLPRCRAARTDRGADPGSPHRPGCNAARAPGGRTRAPAGRG